MDTVREIEKEAVSDPADRLKTAVKVLQPRVIEIVKDALDYFNDYDGHTERLVWAWRGIDDNVKCYLYPGMTDADLEECPGNQAQCKAVFCQLYGVALQAAKDDPSMAETLDPIALQVVDEAVKAMSKAIHDVRSQCTAVHDAAGVELMDNALLALKEMYPKIFEAMEAAVDPE
ncbi:hypothetical protein LCGC14_1507080 [marine sediment metagenome]|uniref:Uncharacterized protein n=1 Tax=marine sediment metagenome TaxID=412755 RepID=A0A0F9JN84_9ZZZZ